MEEEKRVVVEEGEYIGELTDIKDIDGRYGPCVRFLFTIVGDEYDGAVVSYLCTKTLSPGNKLDTALRGLGVEPLEIGDEIDSESLIGRKARIYVEHGTDKSGRVVNNVTRIKPFKGGQKVQVSTSDPVKQEPAPEPDKNLGTKEVKTNKPDETGISFIDEIEF